MERLTQIISLHSFLKFEESPSVYRPLRCKCTEDVVGNPLTVPFSILNNSDTIAQITGTRNAHLWLRHVKPLAKKYHYLANLKGSWTFARANVIKVK